MLCSLSSFSPLGGKVRVRSGFNFSSWLALVSGFRYQVWCKDCGVGWIMDCIRSWKVESKEFEVLNKGGATRVRIVERSHNKRRSIFVQRSELAWLVKSAEEVVELETSEVFWDQSRAGYPRIIVQKRANRHGRFLTIKEFEGRRRIGTVLVLEGRYGQGWSCLISKLRQVKASLWVGREIREGKEANPLES